MKTIILDDHFGSYVQLLILRAFNLESYKEDCLYSRKKSAMCFKLPVTREEQKSREDKGLEGQQQSGVELKDNYSKEEVQVPYCGLSVK